MALLILCGKPVFAFSAATSFATAATAQSDDAADMSEPTAAFVSFQRQQPNIPRCNNTLSAPTSLIPACHFSDHKEVLWAGKMQYVHNVP